MPASDHRLTTAEMAEFVANGYLRFDGLVPDSLNKKALIELTDLYPVKVSNAVRASGLNPKTRGISETKERVATPESLSPLSECYPPPSAIGEMLRLPQVHGIIESLAGPNPLFDHDFVHFIAANSPTGQHLHVDAVIDNRDPSFDIQLFYFPTEVKPGAGGTRFVPGSHLRYTRAEGIALPEHFGRTAIPWLSGHGTHFPSGPVACRPTKSQPRGSMDVQNSTQPHDPPGSTLEPRRFRATTQ